MQYEVIDRDLVIAENSLKGNWVVYVVSSVPNPRRTYCGVTNDLKHRLRQHNGEIKGGAVATKTNRPWQLAALAVGFGTDKSTAMRFEWFCKVSHYRNKAELAEQGMGPNRRLFLMEYSKTKCCEACSNIRILVCNSMMFSNPDKEIEQKRHQVLNVVVTDTDTEPETEEK